MNVSSRCSCVTFSGRTTQKLANALQNLTSTGLALAHRLAASLGAPLELEARKGQGSTFVVTIPKRAALLH